ncbi:MAG: serine--tRNA ligase [Planctomycetes bacterium]|nr:serine--tRNA ligase [Planctomycetota bacterium]
MIDIKDLRADPDKYVRAAADKAMAVDVPAIVELDRQVRDAQQSLQDLRTEQNAASKAIARLQGLDKQAAIAQMAELKTRVKAVSDTLAELEPRLHDQLLLVVQPAAPEVPIGKDESESVELRSVGEIPSFDFEPKDHMQLGEALGIIDMPRGVKLAGARNYVLKGAGVLLHQAVLRLGQEMIIRRGFTPMAVPVLVREQVMYGTGYFPTGRDQAYLAERDGLSLVGTAEVPLTALHSDEILDEAELPKKYCAMSACFRREAGAAGKDAYGLYRIHFFEKVEQVVVCRNDEAASVSYQQEILANAEALVQALNLPYRVVNVCTGDLGQGAVQKFDIETWMPSRNSYGETHSASRFHEFQARRLNLRYRDAEGKVQFCHTLNNTVVASPRILIPILELHQNADGSVTVPQALRPYMNGMERLTMDSH